MLEKASLHSGPQELKGSVEYQNVGNFWEWEKKSEFLKETAVMKARLLANENPYGPSEATKKVVIDSVMKGNRYGHSESSELISMIAKKEGVSKESIMIAPGSSDLLEKTAITHFMKGGNIVSADPAYMSIIKTAESMQATWKPVPLTSTWAHDLKGMEAAIDAQTQLVYICNPNNPTGTITDGKALWDFCSKVSSKVPVFVDEAYLEFMDPTQRMSMVGLINEGKNVIVCRTFSKIYGMAGLRVGYIVAQPEVIKKIDKITRSNMSMNVTAVHGAIAALKDTEFVESCYTKNTACREYVCSELSKMGYDYLPSHTSFVLFPIAMNGQKFLGKMMEQGIGVRSFEIFGQTYCRVSIGTMSEMELFVDGFKKVMV
jgi:histidinol-phosphate aminotransferase